MEENNKDLRGNSRKKRKAKKNPIIIIIMIILLLVGIFAGYKIVSILLDYKKGDDFNDSVGELFITDYGEMIEANGYKFAPKNIDFAELKKANPDVYAWIELPNAVIDYPVVKTNDNETYLHRDLYGAENSYGTLFGDYRVKTDFSENLEIIYGHHMKSGAMFAGLEEFKNQDYYNEHKFFVLYTPDANYLLEPYAGITIGGQEDIYTECTTAEDYSSFIQKALSNSTFKSDISMDGTSRTVALYTCTYTAEDARFIVLCKLTKIQ